MSHIEAMKHKAFEIVASLVADKVIDKEEEHALRQAIATEESSNAANAAATQMSASEVEPVAYVTGVYAGRFTYAPIKASVVLPVGMAFYTHPQPKAERNFCERCGKRLFDGIHTCTPPVAHGIKGKA